MLYFFAEVGNLQLFPLPYLLPKRPPIDPRFFVVDRDRLRLARLYLALRHNAATRLLSTQDINLKISTHSTYSTTTTPRPPPDFSLRDWLSTFQAIIFNPKATTHRNSLIPSERQPAQRRFGQLGLRTLRTTATTPTTRPCTSTTARSSSAGRPRPSHVAIKLALASRCCKVCIL